MSFILGLDVSTACTGLSVFNGDHEFVGMGAIELSKIKGFYHKADIVRQKIDELSKQYKISHIYIEENLQSFRRGFSSAQTLSTLARFNGVVSLISYETFGIEPVHINVNAARKALGIKLVRKSKGGAPTKQQIFEWVDNDLAGLGTTYQWPIKILRSGPRKGFELLDHSAYDMADAYVIAK